MREIFMLFKRHKGRLVLTALLYAIATVCSVLMPYEMSNIVNYGIREQNYSYIIRSGVIMTALAAAALVISVVTSKINVTVACDFENDLRNKIFKKINTLSFEEFSQIGTSSMLTRATEDVRALHDFANMGVYTLVSVPIMFAGGVILVMSKDVTSGIIMLCVSPIVLTAAYFIAKKLDYLWNRADKFTDAQNRLVRERLTGIRVLRAFDKENEQHGNIAVATKEMVKCFIRSNILGGLINPLAMFALNAATVAVLYVSAGKISFRGALSAGDVIAAVQYVGLILNGLLILSWSFAWIPHMSVCIKRIGEVLKMKGVESDSGVTEKLGGALRLANVSFSYDGAGNAAVADIDIDIKNGETAAIIGGTGCGKTTIVKLLLGFYKPTAGEIFLGGKNYRELTKETIRGNISVALQKAMIFAGTVRENIGAGTQDASDERIYEAACVAQLSEFLEDKPEGLDYEFKQSGSNASGGQKQRVNIARTILKPASVYVFDDSFSALDFLTESKLRKALNSYLKNKTQLIITQRIATAMRCDKIYVLDDGKQAGAGTHAQLMKTCQVYGELYRSQLGGDCEMSECVSANVPDTNVPDANIHHDANEAKTHSDATDAEGGAL